MTAKAGQRNAYDSRESWLKAAEIELRPYFESCDYPLPENIRHAIAFPSTGRNGRRVGECWHCSTSEDNHFEIIIRADIAEPVEVLGVLMHELTHAALPPDAGHGKKFKDAAIKLGLEGQMRHAMPNQLLTPRLKEIAEKLGPLPHARLKIDWDRDGTAPADRPKKQRTRLLKAECTTLACGYTVRITSKWVTEVGPPHCPNHGAMQVERAEQDDGDGDDDSV
jgi:hypothetical protein